MLLALLSHALPAHALGQKRLAWFDAPPADAVALARNGQAAKLFVDASDYPGVVRAAGDLQADIARVSAARPALNTSGKPAGATWSSSARSARAP
jgi:hypothetical protein